MDFFQAGVSTIPTLWGMRERKYKRRGFLSSSILHRKLLGYFDSNGIFLRLVAFL
jgi:hypothetical protein